MFKRWFQPASADGEFQDETHRNGGSGPAVVSEQEPERSWPPSLDWKSPQRRWLASMRHSMRSIGTLR